FFLGLDVGKELHAEPHLRSSLAASSRSCDLAPLGTAAALPHPLQQIGEEACPMAMAIDSIARRSEGVVLLLGRLALGALFIPSGLGKLMALGGFAQSLAAKSLPAAMVFAILGAGV